MVYAKLVAALMEFLDTCHDLRRGRSNDETQECFQKRDGRDRAGKELWGVRSHHKSMVRAPDDGRSQRVRDADHAHPLLFCDLHGFDYFLPIWAAGDGDQHVPFSSAHAMSSTGTEPGRGMA